jgi:SAM-dependent methyltransferase
MKEQQMSKSTEFLNQIIQEIEREELVSAVISSPWEKDGVLKISIRPLLIQGISKYQVSEQYKQKIIHRNLLPKECILLLHSLLPERFRQAVFTMQTAIYHLLVNQQKKVTVIKKEKESKKLNLEHNKMKEYILKQNSPIPFLVELGVMKDDGTVVAKKYDKFRQINRFVEIIDDLFDSLPKERSIEIVDFGCGKSYLTFALYHYLYEIKKCNINILGIDLKKDVVEACSELAKKLDYKGLRFVVGDINAIQLNQNLDLMISLHACDTATDAALEKAIKSNAKVILAVPCCQHELSSQIKNASLISIMRHGILKERLAALVTDAARAELLALSGYDVQIMEFIDLEHTPKNLLIRAIKSPSAKKIESAEKRYQLLKESMQIDPSLERRLNF